MNGKDPRKVNIELLRIICILGITAPHYLYWNDAILLTTNTVTALRVTGSVIESLCNPSMACYVLISGYCGRSTQFRPGRIVRLIAQVWFWSVLLHVAAAAAGLVPLYAGIWDLATYVLPIMTGHYWFATAFVVMEILAPILNAGAQKVSRQTLQGVIGALLLYESVFKTIIPFQLNQDEMGYDFGFFLLIFLIGVYLRTYGIPERLNTKRKALAGYLASCCVTACVQIGASVLHARTGSFSWLMSTPFHCNFLFEVTASVCLFLVFLQWEIGHSKILPAESGTSAGVPAVERTPSCGMAADAIGTAGPFPGAEAEAGVLENAKHREKIETTEKTFSCKAAGASKESGVAEGLPVRLIRRLAPLTFGVYLIQCHADLYSRWPAWLAGLAGMNAETSGTVVFFLWMVASVLLVFVVGSALDALRGLLFRAVETRIGRGRRRTKR